MNEERLSRLPLGTHQTIAVESIERSVLIGQVQAWSPVTATLID